MKYNRNSWENDMTIEWFKGKSIAAIPSLPIHALDITNLFSVKEKNVKCSD